MKTIAIALAAVLAAPACGKKEEKPEAPKKAKPAEEKTEEAPKPETIKSSEVRYKTGDTEFRGYISTPLGNDKAPGVLVVHEWWGHNDFARARARQLAEMGYVALAVDMYGDGKQASHPKDAMAFATEATKDKAVTEARFVAALEQLKKHERTDGEKIAAIGYCFGGGVILEMAKRGLDIDLFASFHGMLSTETAFEKGTIKGKVFVAHGAADGFIKPETVELFQKQMKEAAVDFEFVAYEGAKHAFTNPEADANAKKFGIDLAYDKEADTKSWARLGELLTAAFQ